jgi:uncharacterized membrane protein YciS (DUF1049 family)
MATVVEIILAVAIIIGLLIVVIFVAETKRQMDDAETRIKRIFDNNKPDNLYDVSDDDLCGYYRGQR